MCLALSVVLLPCQALSVWAEERVTQAGARVALNFDPPQPASELPITRTLLARRLSEAPRIDGRIDDKAWRSASTLGAFHYAGTTKKPAPIRTHAFVGHFAGVLYVAAQCDEPDMKRLGGQAEVESETSIMSGDGFEICLDSFHDRRIARRVIINPAGAVAECVAIKRLPDLVLPWDSHCVSAVAKNANGWSVEVAIPRSALDAPHNDIIGFNLIRRRPGTEGAPFAWSPTPAGSEPFASLGNLSFETRPCSIQKVEVGWPYVGNNRVRVWLRNGSTRDLKLHVSLATRRPDRKVDRSRYKLILPAGKITEHGFAHRFGASGRCDLVFTVMDEADEHTIAQFMRPNLEVADSPLVLESARPGRNGTMLRARFRILLPMHELADARLVAQVRDLKSSRRPGTFTVDGPESRSGEVEVGIAALPTGEYRLNLRLSKNDVQLALARQTFTVPPEPEHRKE